MPRNEEEGFEVTIRHWNLRFGHQWDAEQRFRTSMSSLPTDEFLNRVLHTFAAVLELEYRDVLNMLRDEIVAMDESDDLNTNES